MDTLRFFLLEEDGSVGSLEIIDNDVMDFNCFFVSEKFFDVVLVEGFDITGPVGREAVEAFSVYYDSTCGVNGFFVTLMVPGDGLSIVASKVSAQTHVMQTNNSRFVVMSC